MSALRIPRWSGNGTAIAWFTHAAVGLMLAGWMAGASGTAAPAPEELLTETQPGVMIQKEREVRYKQATAAEVPAAVPQPLHYDDWLRTLNLSRAAIRLNDRSHLRLREFTRLEIRRQAANPNVPWLTLHSGAVHVTSRGGAQAIPITTPHVRAVPKGTEFLVTVDAASDRTEVTMFDGEAELSDGQMNRTVRSGQQGIVAPGRGIVIRPLLEARNLVQWWIYYPAVLDPSELGASVDSDAALRESLAAYRAGDLAGALEKYPGYPEPASPAGEAPKTYLAALFLAVGAVDRAERELAPVAAEFPTARALWTLIRAVRNDSDVVPPPEPFPQSRDPSHEPRTRQVGRDVSISPSESAAHAPPMRRRGGDTAPYPVHAPNARGQQVGAFHETASELLALSYAHQQTNDLAAALRVARAATQQAPAFGFAWARLGELEFSFGRTRAARAAIDRALELAPRHAQAEALRGFLLAADNRLPEAIAAFDAAIALDPALGNAWLGRGLCKRRAGWFHGRAERFTTNTPPSWIEDIEAAAALEPRRSLFRSYAGKAFADAGWDRLARKELDYARQLDPLDPTPWLYSALLEQEQHRDNRAVSELERSVELNDNRAVYRSRFLLDEDRAVRSSSLAHVYQSAGLDEVSYREAARAVSADYANYSAHLFLSESYNVWRDPARFYLRYETPWFSELLLANLLAPVGGTPLSPHISQQEYSRLFSENRIGLSSTTTYRSDGQVSQLASQYGNAGTTAWSLDLDYQHNDGVRPNNDLERIEWYTTVKQQLSTRDSVLLLAKYQDYRSGDNFQYYDPANARPHYRFDEFQTPILLGGYHREWAPGVHTLLLGGRLQNESHASDEDVQVPLVATWPGTITVLGAPYYDVQYEKEFEAYTAELNQIFQNEHHTLNLGARFQSGEFNARNWYSLKAPDFLLEPFYGAIEEAFERVTAYGYYTIKPVEPLVLQAGLAYDRVMYPTTVRNPPVTPGTTTRDQLGPKGSVVWTPSRALTLRGAYSRSLSGVTLDQSYRLEPTQLAGFVQSYRELMPIVGPVSAADHEIAGVALDVKLATRTYAGLQVDRLAAESRRRTGTTFTDITYMFPSTPTADSMAEELRYLEQSIGGTVNQLVSKCWSFGARYSFNRAELRSWLPDMTVKYLDMGEYIKRSELHRAGMFARFNHDSGLFAQGELDWYWQSNWQRSNLRGRWVSGNLPGDDFPQLNLLVGWRFPRQRGELAIGVLNLTDTDSHLSSVNFYQELPRERVFYTQLRFRL